MHGICKKIACDRCSIIRSPGFVPIFANAHGVFGMLCELNSPGIASARRSVCPISRSPGAIPIIPILANAHSVLKHPAS
jgi:hypothetical protein